MNKKNKSLRSSFIDAVKNYKEKNFKNAEIICFKILSIDSNYIDALTLLGTISAINKNFEKAKEYMETAFGIDPKMTTQSYIVPGLGDAGDLAFGEKDDE